MVLFTRLSQAGSEPCCRSGPAERGLGPGPAARAVRAAGVPSVNVSAVNSRENFSKVRAQFGGFWFSLSVPPFSKSHMMAKHVTGPGELFLQWSFCL